jgi:type VI secretion system protein ImpE
MSTRSDDHNEDYLESVFLYALRALRHLLAPPAGDPSAAAELTDALRLGRATDWSQAGEGGPMRGLGAVTLLIGEETLTWAEMDKVSFQAAA